MVSLVAFVEALLGRFPRAVPLAAFGGFRSSAFRMGQGEVGRITANQGTALSGRRELLICQRACRRMKSGYLVPVRDCSLAVRIRRA